MRLVHLSVHSFHCIESAEVEFGPGLNVLFGPNELGKSGLAWAIRAVLLLQHNSAAHEPFVTWYGGGTPRVALTFCDDDDRIWRVTKIFASGAAGRSSLEASRDGRTFVPDCTGRQVDEKLRLMFRWGVQPPGGQGPRGLPESFLTQVLLAEQDNVRKVLFKTSLADDLDQSGRVRLVEALGALAQDPLFKEVLEGAQKSVSKAFTPTGRKKKTADSPYLEIAGRLNALHAEHIDLSHKVRETEAAEVKVRELNGQRDDLHRAHDESVEALMRMRAHFEARQRSDELRAQLELHMGTIDGVEALRRRVETSDADVARHKTAADAAAALRDEAREALRRLERALDEARQRLDAVRDDVEHERRTRELEEEKKAAQEMLDEAERAVTQAREALRQASAIASEVADARATALDTTRLAKAAEEKATAAIAELGRAQQAHADATQRLRDVSSDDRARQRELQRKDIDNRRLKCAAQRGAIEQDLRVARGVGETFDDAVAARAAQAGLDASVATARQAVERGAAELIALEGASSLLNEIEAYGELLRVRRELDAAIQAEGAAMQARSTAAVLRDEATALRAKVRPSLPTTEAIAALRDLRDQYRNADARLGGGISVTLRPKVPFAIIASADGVAVPAPSTGEPVVLSANQVLLLGLGDLVDIEITAGEQAAREAANTMRERWNREGSPILAKHGVDTVERIEELRRRDDALLRAADQAERDAAVKEERADQVPSTDVTADLTIRLAELQARLGDADRAAVETRFLGLGDRWQAALRSQLEENAAARSARLATLERLRGELTRLETQLDALASQADTLDSEATRGQAGLLDGWSVLVARHEQELAEVDRHLAALEREAELQNTGVSDDQALAEKQVATATLAVERAKQRQEEFRAEAQHTRDVAVAATTRLAGARARARELDVSGAWSPALESPESPSSGLSLATWRTALSAGEELLELRKTAQGAADGRHAELIAAHALRVQSARAAAAEAEAAAVAGRDRLGVLQTEYEASAVAWNQAQVAAAEAKVQVAQTNVGDTNRAVAALREQLSALEPKLGDGAIDASSVADQEARVARSKRHLDEVQEELAKARGGLEQVGGAIVRDRLRELDQAIEHAGQRERQIEIEYDGWQLLLETLRTSEATQGAHLGRALAGPVSTRFHDLTGGRYGSLELGTDLEASGLQAAGALRPISALSAGTQDQLATLLRLCIAEQLRSAIVLDDHLSQSDPARVAWFNSVLRSAAQQVQIILITCRPAELLGAGEFPRPGESSSTLAAGSIRSVDLSSVIRRFAASLPDGQRPSE